jgi:hypothetical protein
MNHKLFIIFFASVLALPIMDARRCNSCCSCAIENSRAKRFQNELSQSKHENHIIKSKIINLGNDFALSVSSATGKQIGFIHDVFDLSMLIPSNSQIHIQPRLPNSQNKFVRLFYDIDHKGLFTDLPIPGNYIASQISLPERSASSIIIPDGYQAVLYFCDNFNGEFIVATSSQKDFGRFNDRMVSMEIMKIFEEKPEHVVIIHSHPNYNGKKIGMEIGESLKIETSKINSIMIRPGYEVFVYDSDFLIDIYSQNVSLLPKQQQFIATIQAHPINDNPSEFAVFYDDIDYNGPHFTVLDSPVTYNQTNGKLSSIKIPQNYEVVLYEKENMQGASIVLTGDIPNLVFYLFNDRAMTIVYQKRSLKQLQNVVIYTRPNFAGESRTIPMGYSIIQEEFYVGSIKVPSGFLVIIEKLPIYPFNYERKYVYLSDSSNTIDYFDTPLISVFVGKSLIF